MKTKSFIMKAVMVSLVLIFIFSVLGYAIMSKRTGYNRQADPNTMESYKDVLLSDEVGGNGSRYAGRVWADKTVQTHSNNSSTTSNSSLTLTEADDGLDGSVGYNSDFLHVFSTIGSSQVVNQYASKPIDVVLLLDISSSMTNKTGDTLDQNDPLHQVINETNTLIDQLMGNDSALPVHPQNRVGVVVYGGGTQQLLPLGHYEANTKKDINDKQIGEYIKIIEDQANARTNPDGWVERNDKTYFPTVTTNVKSLTQPNTSKVMIADSTYLQGALYQGMNILANEPDTTYQDKVQGKIARTPVMITLTDGATNIVSATTTSRADHDNEYSWDNPYVGVIPNGAGNYANGGANPFYADCNQGTGLTTTLGEGRNTKDNKDIEVQAISTRSVSNLLLAGYYKNKIESHYNTDMINFSIGYNVDTDEGVGPFGREQLMATLDPKEYFNESREYPNDLVDGNNESKVDLAKAEVEATRNAINKYLENKPDDLAQMRFPRDPSKTYTYVISNLWSNFIWNHPTDTQNDLKSFDDIYYVNKYYKADDTEEVSNVFKEILQLITSQTFTPIGGENDNGVKDSLTYMDPIGEYMDVKENSITTSKGTTDMAMLLFGEMHGMVRTAVYDYKFNSDPAHRIVTKDDEGWYDNETGELIGHGETDSNWDVATYRVCGATTREYVSTLNEDEGLTPQQENTIYTLYRFTEDYTERNRDRFNPSYDEEENITYKLSDIRVWTQYTGDYIDETGSGSAIDLGYDEALYVNIPVSALPAQVAKISLDQDGNVVEGGYESNLNNKPASTPFRLFYGIGIQDAIRTEDGTKIDITKLSPEYISKHTDDEGYIYFNSNYWSGSLHTHSNGEEESIGDANFSFSPNSTNRYYAFQKPLILYEDPNQDPKQSHEDVLEIGNNNYENFKSGLKTVSDVSQLDSNKYYFIEGEYYVPTDENGNAEETHILASRKGSEFGSEIPGAEIRRILRMV